MARIQAAAQDPAWELEFESLAFTAEALFAHPDPDDAELGRLATRVGSVLADWEEIDFDGRHLRRASIQAAARVRAADAALDHTIGEFARELLLLPETDAGGAMYARFFPEPHEDVIDLGLDAELPSATLIVLALDQDETLPEPLRFHRDPLRAALQLGNSALLERAEAMADTGRHQARVEAWRESAAAMRKSLLRAIGRIAEARKLPPRWVDHFFY